MYAEVIHIQIESPSAMLLPQLFKEQDEEMCVDCSIITLMMEHTSTITDDTKKCCWLGVELRWFEWHIHLLGWPIGGLEGLHRVHAFIEVVSHLLSTVGFIKLFLVLDDLIPNPLCIFQLCELLLHHNLSPYLMLPVYLTKVLLGDVHLWVSPVEHLSSLSQCHPCLMHKSVRWG